MDSSPNAKRLRRSQTEAEARLWHHLRDRGLNGCKFRRQVPIGPHVADFVSWDAKLIVELDGSQHATQEAKDEMRTLYLQKRGYSVLRFWNNEVFENIDGVLLTIADVLVERGYSYQDP